MEVDDGGAGQNLDQMNDKDRKKWEKNLASWRIFMDFILRHVSIVTFKYNCFEHDELLDFLEACDRGEMLRKSTKLKKSESPEINSFKVMRECADLLAAQNFIEESNTIRKFLDIMARVKCISAIATGFYKALKKGNVKGLEKLQYYVDYWKGFCSRNYDFRELAFLNTSHELFSELERRFLAFPTAVRTSINMSQRFLKQASESTGLDLLTTDQRTMEKHMQAAEMVLATHLEQALFNRVMADTKTLMSEYMYIFLFTGNSVAEGGIATKTRKTTALRQRRGDCHAGDLPARCETRGRQRR